MPTADLPELPTGVKRLQPGTGSGSQQLLPGFVPAQPSGGDSKIGSGTSNAAEEKSSSSPMRLPTKQPRGNKALALSMDLDDPLGDKFLEEAERLKPGKGRGKGGIQTGKQPAGMQKLILKNLLSLNQRMRDVEGILHEVLVVATDMGECQAMLLDEQKYSAACKAAGADHSYGPPHPHKYIALLRCLIRDRKDILGQDVHEGLTAHLSEFEQLETPGRLAMLRACRTEKMYDASKKRLVLCFGPAGEKMKLIVLASMIKLGAEHKEGRAPPGGMERGLQECLEALSISSTKK